MKYHDFRFVFDFYSEHKLKGKDSEFDLGKVREKFTEIVDAVGINSRLLKQFRDEQSGKMVKFGRGKPQFCFPETVCDFCAELIFRYTSPDFKKIRAAKFTTVNPEVSLFLMDGFTRYLQDLGYDVYTIVSERWKMDRRLHHHLNVLKFELSNASMELASSAQKYEQFLRYEDSAYFIRHMVTKVNCLAGTIEQIFSEYEAGRYEEIAKIAAADSAEKERTMPQEDILQESLLADALEHDKKYQKLSKKLDDIIAEPGFKRGAQGRYNKIAAELSSIRREHEIALFGDTVSERVKPDIYLKHPMEILGDAVFSVLENQLNQIEREETESSLTEDQVKKREEDIHILREFYEKRGVSFDLPGIDNEEEELFASSLPNHEVKGKIAFSCCETERIVVYKGSTGCSAIKCPQCGQISIFDFDKMASKTVSQIRHSKFQEP